ncbi:MAG: hypothetical protein U0176_17245 [Bacteroidia bacterium]
MKTHHHTVKWNGTIATHFLLVLASLLLIGPSLWAQCTNASAFGFSAAPVNTTLTVTTCQFAGEYHEISGCTGSTSYQSTSSIPTDFITVHQGTFNGPVVASGLTPLNWMSTVAGSYFVHFNTNSGCGTDFTCRSVTIAQICSTPAPTSVTASPTTICMGATSNVQATSAGNTIHWFTSPTGGVAVGTSASGAPMGVTPTGTTTYYASAFNGTCFSLRTPVTVTVNPAATITSVTATPNPLCIGSSANIVATTCSPVNNFTSALPLPAGSPRTCRGRTSASSIPPAPPIPSPSNPAMAATRQPLSDLDHHHPLQRHHQLQLELLHDRCGRCRI